MIKFNNDIPIYIQIKDLMLSDIVKGDIKPGEKIMSVRELSRKYVANPNTVLKALDELEKIGLIVTESTNGKYVTNNINDINEARKKILNDMILNFNSNALKFGYSLEEIRDAYIKIDIKGEN